MKNLEIAKLFERTAEVMAVLGENSFRVLAYKKIARALEDLPHDVVKLAASEELESVPGIGKSSAEKIQEYLRTGRIEEFDDVLAQIPVGVMEMIKIPSVGPKTAAILWHEGGVTTIEGLKAAIDAGTLTEIKGLGEKKLAKIKENLTHLTASSGRIRLGDAMPLAVEFVAFLKGLPGVVAAQYCGSLRRGKETIGDVDITVSAADEHAGAIAEAVTKHVFTATVIQTGQSKTSVRTGNGVQIDVRVVPPESWGAAIQYFTGSQAHNVRVRELAVKRGMKVNEWGVYKLADGKEEKIAGETEEGVYEAVGMCWIPPEIREDRGEIEAAIAAFRPSQDARLVLLDSKDWIKTKANRQSILAEIFDNELTSFKVFYTDQAGAPIDVLALEAFEVGLMLEFPDPSPRCGEHTTKQNVAQSCIPSIPRFNSQWPEVKVFGRIPEDARAKSSQIIKSKGLEDRYHRCLDFLSSGDGWIDCRTATGRKVVWQALERRQGIYAFRHERDGIGGGYIGITGRETRSPNSQANIQSRVKEHLSDDAGADNFPGAFQREIIWKLRNNVANDSKKSQFIELVEVADIRGDLHMHTVASDGANTIEEMVGEAKRRGYQYIAITDHSKSQFQANGLRADRLIEHIAAIHAVAREAEKSGILVLAGSECDILADGSLDYEDELLAKLDWVVASPHAALSQESEAATARLVRACANPYVSVIGHPTGRIVPSRRGLEPDMAKVIFAAARSGVALEINANYHRLDLRDVHVRMAVEAGVPICIDTDAHSLPDFEQMGYGVLTARRGWAKKGDVLNTRTLAEFKKWLASRKEQAGW